MSGAAQKCVNAQQLRQLNIFGKKVARHGFNFAACDQHGRPILLCEGGHFKTDCNHLSQLTLSFLSAADKNAAAGPAPAPVILDGRFLTAVLACSTAGRQPGSAIAAFIDLGGKRSSRCRKSSPATAILSDMLALFAENFRILRQADEQIELVSAELAQTYEELVLLYKISTNMEIVEPDANFLQLACDSLTDIVDVEGIAVLQEKTFNDEKRLVLVAGSGLIDINEQMTSLLYNHLLEEMNAGKEALLDSEVDAPFKYNWPENIRNIIVVPLCGREKVSGPGSGEPAGVRGDDVRIIGLMVAANRIDKPDFDSTDVKLFTSVAAECAVFVENNRLFSDLKELFIGSLKALTQSIDAKDRYTRGHSERVAFISKWIAEHLAQRENLDQEQIQKIYLAGLLHDIGKIGIDEAVLCKHGKLTEQERTRLKMHPSIGANILSGIKQMRDIIPGVLCHHERIDGKGYPNALKADKIPLMGKIVGLADCFDAITSERAYRDARSIEEAMAEIENRLGAQFDESVGRAFLDSDVYHLWDLMQEGLSKTYGADDFSRYGAEAVGALIR